MMNRNEVLDRLSKLTPEAFEAVVFRLGIPTALLSARGVAQLTRSIEVIRYLESIDRLQEIGPLLAASPPPPPAAQKDAAASGTAAQTDVLIITALREEYDEARKVDTAAMEEWSLDASVPGFEVSRRSYRGRDGRAVRVALTWATRMRTVATAEIAGRLLHPLRPRCLAMSGVCAGRRGKVRPGDVIIGSLLYTYDTGSVRAEDDDKGQRYERFQADPDPWPLNERWRRCAQAFQVPSGASWLDGRPPTLATQGDWLLARLRAGEDPISHPERARCCPAWGTVVGRLRKRGLLTERAPLSMTAEGAAHIEEVLLLNPDGLPEPGFRIHLAPIATGNNVMRDPLLFGRLSNSMREVLGVDMEAAAIAAIAHAHQLPWIVMKAVMDFADEDKDDQFKPFAARASAECLIAFLRENLE